MTRLEGKVAFITGAARGQGRADAIRLAEEGADIILTDVCEQVSETDYAAATLDDFNETVALVEKTGRRVVHAVTDVRDRGALSDLVREGYQKLGRLDVVVANAGIVTWGRFWELDPKLWQDMLDVNLTGVFNTMAAAVPFMIEADNGGSIIAISSLCGVKSLPGQAHYSAAKHGVVGLVKTAAMELAPYRIRVNSIHPWVVRTPMGQPGPVAQKIMADNPSYSAASAQILQDPQVSEPEDIANAVLFLASDESRTMTATQLTVDHGASKT